MTIDEKKVQDLMAECDDNISSGEVNTFASYDEGVRDGRNVSLKRQIKDV